MDKIYLGDSVELDISPNSLHAELDSKRQEVADNKRLFLVSILVICLVIFCFNQGELEWEYSGDGRTDTIYELADHSPPDVVEFQARSKAELLQVKYVERYLALAQTESALFGIPVSIILGQGILESKSGTSSVAQRYNNHFGVRRNGGYQLYLSVWSSWRDHSKVLNLPIYKRLHGLDYKGWAVGLYEAGYADDEAYAEKLINVIERWGLQRYDRKIKGKPPNT